MTPLQTCLVLWGFSNSHEATCVMSSIVTSHEFAISCWLVDISGRITAKAGNVLSVPCALMTVQTNDGAKTSAQV